MARRGDARLRFRTPQPFLRPRRGRRTPRPAPGRGVEEAAAAQAPQSSSTGIFVTIEGLDFSGKSTLVRHLKTLLAEVPAHFTREPGGTPVAELIREILLDPEVEMDPWTEAYLYAAARADHVRGGIMPRLERGVNVICERYLDSSVAYQGFGRELGADAVRDLNSRAVGGVVPDLTFYLRLGADERERRARQSGATLDRIEKIGAAFMRRVERGFEEIMRREPDRIVALDATLSPEELAGLVVGGMRGLR